MRTTVDIDDALLAGMKVSLTTVSGNGLCPGVDLDDNAALRDLMDQQ